MFLFPFCVHLLSRLWASVGDREGRFLRKHLVLPHFTCCTSTKVQILTHQRGGGGADSTCAHCYAQFTCCTSTKVQVLTCQKKH